MKVKISFLSQLLLHYTFFTYIFQSLKAATVLPKFLGTSSGTTKIEMITADSSLNVAFTGRTDDSSYVSSGYTA